MVLKVPQLRVLTYSVSRRMVTLAQQNGGPEIPKSFDLAVLSLRKLLSRLDAKDYTLGGKLDFALILRVNGRLTDFGPEGVEGPRLLKGYIQVDIVVPDNRWRASAADQRIYLSNVTHDALMAIADTLERKKRLANRAKLIDDYDSIRRQYLSETSAKELILASSPVLEPDPPVGDLESPDRSMIKLYRLSRIMPAYWETWQEDRDSHIVHWGRLGTRGHMKTVQSTSRRTAAEVIRREMAVAAAKGFVKVQKKDHFKLIVEYLVKGRGSLRDVEKRHRLEARMNETLGWTGLGSCDGGSMGSGTMEVCNLVVDFERAQKVIRADLAETEFANYSRIYLEGFN